MQKISALYSGFGVAIRMRRMGRRSFWFDPPLAEEIGFLMRDAGIMIGILWFCLIPNMRSFHWERACHYFKDGQLEIDNNQTGPKIRPLGHKNHLFAGSHEAAACYESAFFVVFRKEEINPGKWPSYVFSRMQDHPIKQIHQLLPFHWKQEKEAIVQQQPLPFRKPIKTGLGRRLCINRGPLLSRGV
jgi:hypothetical protein